MAKAGPVTVSFDWETLREVLDNDINRLAQFIMDEIPGEPCEGQGAIDTAIRLLRAAYVEGALVTTIVKSEKLDEWERKGMMPASCDCSGEQDLDIGQAEDNSGSH